jgi:hypothetical protein
MTEDRGAAERRAMEQVVFRLREAYASRVSEREIGERVQEVFHRFDGSKVREFIPLLVENAVRRELVRGPQAIPGSGGAVSRGAGPGGVAAGTGAADIVLPGTFAI